MPAAADAKLACSASTAAVAEATAAVRWFAPAVSL